MKVIKKPKFKEQVCLKCRAVIKIDVEDIFFKNDNWAIPAWQCPFCKEDNLVDFGEKEIKLKTCENFVDKVKNM